MNQVVKTLRITILIFGIFIFVLLMFPVIGYDSNVYTGYEIIIGKEIIDINPFNLGSVASAHLEFSWFALMAFLLPLVSAVISSVNKPLRVIGLIEFVISLFLLINIPDQINILTIIGGTENYVSVSWSMEYALMVAITINILAILSSALLIYNTSSKH